MDYYKSQEADSILKYDSKTGTGCVSFIEINPDTNASTGITIMRLDSYEPYEVEQMLATYLPIDESEYLQHREGKYKDYWEMTGI